MENNNNKNYIIIGQKNYPNQIFYHNMPFLKSHKIPNIMICSICQKKEQIYQCLFVKFARFIMFIIIVNLKNFLNLEFIYVQHVILKEIITLMIFS